jgi:hypothetical protein
MFQTTGESHSLFLLLYTVKGLGHVHALVTFLNVSPYFFVFEFSP